MTRFWITLDQGVRFVISCIEKMHGGEIFVPKIPSMKLIDLAKAIAPECEIEYSGIRPGEKIHEILISEDEVRATIETDNMYIIEPVHPWWRDWKWDGGKQMQDGFRYSSDSNTSWISGAQLKEILRESK